MDSRRSERIIRSRYCPQKEPESAMLSTSSTASLSTAEAPRRMFVPTWTWTKPAWPQPELSCGRELEALDGSHRCWEVTGPVSGLAKTIYGEVKNLLDLRSDYLIERERIIEPVLFSMYMTGRRKEEANPTLLFSCTRIQPRKRAKEVVKESGILKDHPAIRLAHSKRPPQALRPFRILVGSSKDINQGGTFGEVYCISPVDRTCGVPVVMRRKDRSFRNATIGGIVQLDNTYYGLTVAHAFDDDTGEGASDSDEGFSDLDCSFDSEGDFSEPEVPENPNQSARPERHHNRGRRTREEQEISSFGTQSLSRALQHIDEDQARSSVVGSLFKSSTHTGLDWALVEIDNSRVDPSTCNAITISSEYEQKTLWPRTLVTTGPTEREVLAITGDKGVISGIISQSSIYMRTAQSRTFQELWTIHMKSDLVEGDCGSWVVDHGNGQLYGQIVAGHPGTGVGYIIPASQIFENVLETLGEPLLLPSGLSLTPFASLPQHIDSPGLRHLDLVRDRQGFAHYALPYIQRYQTIKSPSSTGEAIFSSQPRLRPAASSKADGIAEGKKEEPGNEYYQVNTGPKKLMSSSSPTESSGRESNQGQKPEASISTAVNEGKTDRAIAKVLQRNEKDARRSERHREPSPINKSRPTYTRLSRRHLSLETLRMQKIDFEVDEADPDYVLIKRWVPESEQDILWEHTRRIRSSRLRSGLDSDIKREGRRSDSTLKPSIPVYDTVSSSRTTIVSDAKESWGRRDRMGYTARPQNSPADTLPVIAFQPGQPPLVPISPTYQPNTLLPEGWISHFDESTARPYYIHVPTQAVQWEFPTFLSILPPSQAVFQPAYGSDYGEGAIADERTRMDPRKDPVEDEIEAMRQRLRERQQREYSSAQQLPSWAVPPNRRELPAASDSSKAMPIPTLTDEVVEDVVRARPNVPNARDERRISKASKSSGRRAKKS